MKTVFSSQNGKQIMFLPSSRGYPYVWLVWKSVFYLNRHHITAHKQRDARVALESNFKGKIHSQQKLFAKCMTEMFALNYVLRVSSGP